MKSVRLPLTALALVTLAACSADVVGPQEAVEQTRAIPSYGVPGGPNFNGSIYMGSGAKSDSTTVSGLTDTDPTTTVVVLP